MVEILRHSQTKGRDNRKLKHRPKQARLSSTLQGGMKCSLIRRPGWASHSCTSLA